MSEFIETFGCDVFNPQTMKQRLPYSVFLKLEKAYQLQEPLDTDIVDDVAKVLKEWAIEKGATHYTHWFFPMSGITAEKHESFLFPDGKGGAITDFSKKELIKGEPDASSFPSGGMRTTFEARGYTMWDPTSYAFVKDKTLYIPTLFLSFDGECLDKKTPLLRSMASLDKETTRLLHAIGEENIKHVTTSVGCEQEYFLIDSDLFEQRLDLKICGRTLLGAAPVKGQELSDHYFANLPRRIKSFMEDLDDQLWKLGIYAKTEHKEVAPRQFELAPVFTTANIACDHNQMTMEVMKAVAHKHGFECLLMEKPFDFINGSGKHNNWSLMSDKQENLLSPGKHPENNLRFLLLLTGVIKAVDQYQDLLRISVASAGNDHRLGGHEAPPAILSIYLGEELSDILDSIEKDIPYHKTYDTQLNAGVKTLTKMKKDKTDRNRTSPFAFTGNKFEFRMLGSSISIACPNTILYTIVADAYKEFADELEASQLNKEDAIRTLIKNTMIQHKRIIFNGNGYESSWVEEAKNRGLLNLKTTVDALIHYTDEKNIELFKRHHIYSMNELQARENILLDNYYQNIHIEAKTLLYMIERQILPAVEKYQYLLYKTLHHKKEITGIKDEDLIKVNTIDKLYYALMESIECLKGHIDTTSDNEKENAFYAKDVLLKDINDVRSICDTLERHIPAYIWPLPDYNDMLFKTLD